MPSGRDTQRAWPAVTVVRDDWRFRLGGGGGGGGGGGRGGASRGGGGGGSVGECWRVASTVAKIRCFPLFLQLVDHLWRTTGTASDEESCAGGEAATTRAGM